MGSEKGLNSAHLKYIAVAVMLLDHIGAFFRPEINTFIQAVFPVDWPWDYYIYAAVFSFGRIAFPLFAFQLSEGIRYTGKPRRYMGRLLVFGVISEVPFRWMQQVMAGEVLYVDFAFRNVMFTMFLAVLACYLYREVCVRGYPASGGLVPVMALILLAEWLNTDYGAVGVALIFGLYLASQKSRRIWLLVFWSMYTYFISAWSNGDFYGHYGWYYVSAAALRTVYAMLAIPLIMAYNGNKGKTGKYLFYLFYPVHLWILAVIYIIMNLK